MKRAPLEPIAVVGLSCIYPGSIDVERFFENLKRGKDLIGDIPRSHWLIEDFYDADPRAPEKVYAKKGGIIPEVAFDYMKFGMPPNVLQSTDSGQLLALVAAKMLFDNAFGEEFHSLDRERVSVILGYSMAAPHLIELAVTQAIPLWVKAMKEAGLSDEQIAKVNAGRLKYSPPMQENSFPGVLQNVVAGRIANRFDLHGTNCVIDAACASSLSAINLAMRELWTGDSDLVVTGGVQTTSTPMVYMCFCKTGALSFGGVSRPFDARCDGMMMGEGLGLVALRRLSDAERDGNKIYAVLRGLGTSSDGRGKSIYAPEPEGQKRALRRCYQHAGYGPETVGLVEAHGTGTRAGDAAELKALSEVFSESGRADPGWCAIGSVKSQIGHTAGAAGAASLIKAILALHHKVLPPTINVEEPTPAIDWERGPLYINSESRPWIHGADHPRRASLSSFGFGGTNYHLTLEEYRGEHRPPRLDRHGAEAVLASAGSRAGLLETLRALRAQVEAGASLFATAKASHRDFRAGEDFRLAVVARSQAELRARLDQAIGHLEKSEAALWLPPQGIYFRPGFKPAKVAMLFSGQGSQSLGMGGDWAMHLEEVGRFWDRIDALTQGWNARLSEVVFPRPVFSEEARQRQRARLTATEWAQPAIGATSAALYQALVGLGVKPDMMGGHSFGELTALYAAGVFDLAGFLSAARHRGEAMAQASESRGAMLAVAEETEALKRRLEEWQSSAILANLNAPRQQILSGEEGEIHRVQALLEAAGVKVTRLNVSTAFHSPLVSGAAKSFGDFLQKSEMRPPSLPVYSNQGAEPYPEDLASIRRRLADHLANPVRFCEEVGAMRRAGANVFLEVGPGSTLSRLVEECLPGEEILSLSFDQKGQEGMVALTHGLAKLAAAGLELAWQRLDDRELAALEGFEMTPTTILLDSSTHKKKYPVPETAARDNVHVLPKPAEMPIPVALAAGAEADAPRPMPAAPSFRTGPKAPVSAPVLTVLKAQEEAPAKPTELPRPSAQELTALKGLLYQVVSEKTGYPTEMLGADMHLEADLGIDSIKRVEIFSTIRDRVPHLPEVGIEQLVALQTMGQIIEFMEKGPAVAPASPPPAETPIAPEIPAASAGVAPPPAEVLEEAAASLTALLYEVVSEKTGYPTEMLGADMHLEADLGIDSIKRVEIFSAIKDRAAHLPEVGIEQLVALQTIGQIISFMRSGAGLEGSPAVSAGEPAPSTPTSPPPRTAEIPVAVEPAPAPAAAIGRFGVELVSTQSHSHVTLAPNREILVVSDGGGIGEVVRERLIQAGFPAHLVEGEDQIDEQGAWGGLIYMGGLRSAPNFYSAAKINKEAFRIAKKVGPALRDAAAKGGAWFVTVQDTGGHFGFQGLDPISAAKGGLAGLAKTLAREWSGVYCKAIDLPIASISPETAASEILQEIFQGGGEVEIGLPLDGRRLTVVPREQNEVSGLPLALDQNSVLVASGGARGVTAACIIELAKKYRLKIVLFGRSQVPEVEPEAYRSISDEAGLKKALFQKAQAEGKAITPAELETETRLILNAREVRQTLKALREAGSEVKYFPCDILESRLIRTEGPSWTWQAGNLVRSALAEVRQEWGPITALIHGAGVIADKRIEDKTQGQFDLVFDTKVLGFSELLSALDKEPLKLIVAFSSVAARFGNAGQCDYAMGNEVINKMAQAEKRKRAGQCVVKSINWGAWEGGMVKPALSAEFKRRGISLIPLDVGAKAFVRELASSDANPVEVILGAPL
ncbi:MAG TPA: SDR family NAD(P)-dependent oxidoreductase [bacterium]|nr:SDR family NAD(P)-dependent oxidoreductase [bacterium]